MTEFSLHCLKSFRSICQVLVKSSLQIDDPRLDNCIIGAIVRHVKRREHVKQLLDQRWIICRQTHLLLLVLGDCFLSDESQCRLARTFSDVSAALI